MNIETEISSPNYQLYIPV